MRRPPADLACVRRPEDTTTRGRRRSLHELATRGVVARYGRALVPRGGRRAGGRRLRACGDSQLAPPPGLAASRLRRAAWKRRRYARRARATALALSPAVIFLLAALRSGGDHGAGRRGGSAQPDLPARQPTVEPAAGRAETGARERARGARRLARARQPKRVHATRRTRGRGSDDRVASRDLGRPAVRRQLDRRHAASRRRAELGHLEPGHRQRPECAEAAVRQRAHDPRDRLGDRRVPRREPGGAARRRRRHQPRGRRADDGRARLPPERARRRRLLPAGRRDAARAARARRDRSPARAGSPRPVRRRRSADGFRRLLDRAPWPGGSRDPVPGHENHMHVRFPPPGG